jgi:hypothetical protein
VFGAVAAVLLLVGCIGFEFTRTKEKVSGLRQAIGEAQRTRAESIFARVGEGTCPKGDLLPS